MPYLATNYSNNASAPVNKWVCAPTSILGPFDAVPTTNTQSPNYCGQCVSYVRRVCPALPQTTKWTKGQLAKGNAGLAAGTVIATFAENGSYSGHAAIYENQDSIGLRVYDQYATPPMPKPVGARILRFGAAGNSNNGDLFYVVEPPIE